VSKAPSMSLAVKRSKNLKATALFSSTLIEG
jgi:hypothetical protein